MSTDFQEILKYQISWISVWWEPSCSIQTYGQADITKLIVAFRDFASAPKTVENTGKISWNP